MDAWRLGVEENETCPNCGNSSGKKLTKELLGSLAHRFFVWGSLHKCDFGAAPVIQFNEHQKTSIDVSHWLKKDVQLFENFLGVGFFHYGPRLWMVGEIEPLKV
ncbi:MAG: hypothetical protein PHY16_18845 [Methylobacter sp.]|nr:hypothetical protein [Methylobacter sp.]